MSFISLSDYSNKVVIGGQTHSSTFRKTTTVVTTAGVWFDGSNMSGHPVTNFYASTPLKAEYLLAREGIQHGSNVSSDQKHLKRVTAMCSVAPVNLLFIDSLLYYPFIDGDSTDEQVFDNTNSLTRGLVYSISRRRYWNKISSIVYVSKCKWWDLRSCIV